jgi:glucan endo-1,3-alpha-glucosidase
MVGNTYPYTSATWRQDIGEAMGAGMDGFFLNLGSDSWQADRVRDAYAAGQEMGFKMALSFDMTEMRCGSQAE